MSDLAVVSSDASERLPAAASRTAFIGDVHGHLGDFLVALHSLGVRFDGPGVDAISWPSDLWVVQVGDQVHKGPDSEAVLKLRNELVAASGGRFLDLFGNHEAEYVFGPRFFPTEPGLGSLIRSDGHRRVAVAVERISPEGGLSHILATHAGLTFDFWKRFCGSNPDAGFCAAHLNRMWRARRREILNTGVMLGGRFPDLLAGPVWAHAALELAASWEQHRTDADSLPPFDQVVGHTNPAHPLEKNPPAGLGSDPSSGHSFLLWDNRQVLRFIETWPSKRPSPHGLVPYVVSGRPLPDPLFDAANPAFDESPASQI